MARFHYGLNREIQDVVELQNYGTLGELVHQAMKLRRRSASKRSIIGSSSWNAKDTDEEKVPQKCSITLRANNIKCFKCLGKGHIASQCPNRRAMIMRDDSEVASDSSHEETSTSSDLESCSDDSYFEGDLLMVKRLMGS
ncbi:hypothetical protein CR513_19372, partial [Mucuna pruriens]